MAGGAPEPALGSGGEAGAAGELDDFLDPYDLGVAGGAHHFDDVRTSGLAGGVLANR